MHIHQRIREQGTWQLRGSGDGPAPDLALVFSSGRTLLDASTWRDLRSFDPHARIVGCSTAGEIEDVRVLEDSIVCTAVAFENSRFAIASVLLTEAADSEALGRLLAERLPTSELAHVLVLSDGVLVNGSRLLRGIARALPSGCGVTGGLSADGARFERTAICVDGPQPQAQIVAIGLYGTHLSVGTGSGGGWDSFGIERQITKSQGNVLYEVDGKPALDLYKRYLGDKAIDLPASGLRFPLAIRNPLDAEARPVVRTILSVDEAARSLIFAGDVPVGYRARLMSANLERLIDGARDAALRTTQTASAAQPELALVISCVGRKLVLNQRVEEEVEAVRDALGDGPVIAGFYSYGELSPFASSGRCEFHNQTMTVTTLSER
jgi:hypothetical protein